MFTDFSIGQVLALCGALLAALLAGIGSAKGVSMAGETSAGVQSEHPDITGPALVLQFLPGTQGIYGFLVCVMILMNIGVLRGGMQEVDVMRGLRLFIGSLPAAVGGWVSAIYQGRVASAGINLLAAQPDAGGRAILMTVLVETYAVLALLASILLIM